MAHTRGGGIGDMAGSSDDTRTELIEDIRQRIIMGGAHGDITEDELISRTSFRRGSETLDRDTMLARLE
ncbi:hypothetical protein JQ561_28845 [Bradyrhizobium diazoefficiens]|nr:hypothetical protein [Bradyrhizobium diazoefficiens]MBR0930636.1 hypothetical protein [Bradyrhizobium diazoefficiens]